MPAPFAFEVLAEDPHSRLRAGILHTPHGPIPTPAFMPVGTLATVKSLTPGDVWNTGARCVLANTYHLALRPGPETVRCLGGLHGMMRWDGAILTDSGGFQVFSLGHQRTVDDDGVTFQSHLDGHALRFTPESVVQLEEALGADLIMPLDECVPATATRAEAEAALERTQRWWERSRRARRREDQALFHLVQGGLFVDLRRAAGRFAATTGAPGFAIGGFSIGEERHVAAPVLAATLAELPRDRPRYLMGVGTPVEVVAYARLGVDLFDCVLPTRLARNGAVWADRHTEGRLNLRKRATLELQGPLLEGCPCQTCEGWPAGAVAAFFQAGDPLGYRLASIHNLTVLAERLERLRSGLLASRLKAGIAGSQPLEASAAC
ncbi:MAG: tRNA guanosine(34) transglycosylase Tgt [Chloroflexi bacterium]|nr:tRNA guanosine(34) transglycosylase Tgt [Chloroflexota bacterium]